MIGGTVDLGLVEENWDEVLRLAASIRAGTVPPSVILRKIAAFPRQNALSKALREIGRVERSIFMADWLMDLELRRRSHANLNKGESRHALARAVFFHRLGELRDRTAEAMAYRASGLNLVMNAIILWNTIPCPHSQLRAWSGRRSHRRIVVARGARQMGSHRAHR